MKPSPLVADLVIALLCLIWGSTWLVIRTGLEDLPPLHGVALRFTLASALFWLAAPKLARLEGGDPPALWLVLVFGTLNFATSYAVVYWGETVGDKRKTAPAPTVSAVGQTCVKRHGQGMSSVLLNRGALTLGALMLWILALALEPGAELTFSRAAVGSVVYLAVVGTCVAFGLYYWVLRSTPAYKMSLIAYVTPVIALFLGWALGEEPVGPFTLLGAGLVLGGVGLVRR